MAQLPRSVRGLVVLTSCVGACLLLWALYEANWAWAPLSGLLLALGVSFFRVTLTRYKSGHTAFLTLDVVAVFAMLSLFGTEWALITAAVNGASFGLSNRTPAFKIAFNVGTLSACTFAAGWLTGLVPMHWTVSATVGAIAYVLLNMSMVSWIVALASGRNIFKVWRENFSWNMIPQISMAISGFALGVFAATAGYGALLIALPYPLLYNTYRLYAESNNQHTKELKDLSDQLITTLAAVVEARDAYTFGHSAQVARYSVAIAEKLGYNRHQTERLYQSALLHDIGKVGIPEAILFKPGKLTAHEFAQMKSHSTIGYNIIKEIRPLEHAASVALHHHERWNGSGYPEGLSQEQIELDSRIVGVADTLDTILSDRPYRKGSTLSEALAELDRCSGTLFDPAVVKALHEVVTERGEAFFINSTSLIDEESLRTHGWAPLQAGKR